jgi:hypothetical protein
VKVVLLGGFFHQKTVEIADDGDRMIECYPQGGPGPVWVYKIASAADLAFLGLSAIERDGQRWALFVGEKK